jgi:Protein of unknown function (DUF2867)
MRLSNSEHEAHPWVIAQVASDFELLDVWGLPAQGGPDEFAELVEIVTSLDPAGGDSSRATRALFSLRHRVGALFGWDDGARKLPIPGCAETTLSARVPVALRDTETPPVSVSSTTFIPIYRTHDEWAAEISNGTVHAVMHLAWVEQGGGVYRGQMGVYVKPRGRLGWAYMAVIGPFRHLIVYPALMRQVKRAWEARPSGAASR